MELPAHTAPRARMHYAWIALALTFIMTLVSAAVRSAAGLLINPLEAEFGWSRAAIASAVGLNLLLFGVAGPIAGRFTDRYGPRLVMATSMLLMSLGVAGTLVMREFWHLVLFWGVIIGLGAGGGASVIAASVSTRWFVARRGLALGILNSSSSTGQLLFLPLLMLVIVTFGWRSGSLMMLIATTTVLALVALWMCDDPSDVGLPPYGEAAPVPRAAPATGWVAAPAGPAPASAGRAAPLVTLSTLFRNRTFWFLAGSFAVCGATGNGLVGTHLIPFAIERGIPEVRAATVVGVIGAMNFIGTMISGWLSDRIDPRKILTFVYALRAVSLLLLPFVQGLPGLLVFAMIYGLDSTATVPPTIAIGAATFGKRSVGSVQGWVFLAHQVGASIFTAAAGVIRQSLGSYDLAFFIAAAAGLIGAAIAFSIPRQQAPPVTVAVPQAAS